MSTPSFHAPAPDVILARLGPLIQETVLVSERRFLIQRPRDSDRLLEQPEIYTAYDADQYIPYWADLWPAARMLAKAVLQEPWTAGTEAIEIGCGLGLPGVVALSCGLRVTFSDYDPCALHFAADNARLNGHTDFRVLQLDWRHPPRDLRMPVILGSDLIYELRNVAPLIEFIKQVLEPGGLCLIADQDRVPAHAFRQAIEEAELQYSSRIMHSGEPGGRRLRGTLYRITQVETV